MSLLAKYLTSIKSMQMQYSSRRYQLMRNLVYGLVYRIVISPRTSSLRERTRNSLSIPFFCKQAAIPRTPSTRHLRNTKKVPDLLNRIRVTDLKTMEIQGKNQFFNPWRWNFRWGKMERCWWNCLYIWKDISKDRDKVKLGKVHGQ